MAVDLSAARSVSCSPVSVQEAKSVVDAPTVSPPAFGATAQMAPLTAAGLELIKLVLYLTAAAIVLLIVVLSVTEYRGFSRSNKVLEGAVAQAASTPDATDANRSKRLLAQMRLAQADPAWTLSPSELVNATADLKQLASAAATTPDQRTALALCIPIPPASNATRADTVEKCIATIAQLSAAQTAVADHVKLLEELQKQSDDERQAFRTFWMQVAQLILMNLFFPLITALLGYIFGTQRGGGG
jgi:hypothetical protein